MHPMMNAVANGRRRAARTIVLNAPMAICAQVWRRVTEQQTTPKAQVDEQMGWDDVALSDGDEPDVQYEQIGYACLLFDRYTGGAVLENNTGTLGMDAASLAQIEPFYEDATGYQRIDDVPDWTPQVGDVFGLLIDPRFVQWLELVDITGQTMMPDFGKHYVLNRRDDLTHLEPFAGEFEDRPEV